MQITPQLFSQFYAQLEAAGLRRTQTRIRIFEVLAAASAPLSIQDIIACIGSSHFVSVYRNIDRLQAAGIIKAVPQGLKYRYELSDVYKPHHHHISCTNCAAAATIDDAAIEQQINQLALNADYRLTHHHLELYGRCSKCC